MATSFTRRLGACVSVSAVAAALLVAGTGPASAHAHFTAGSGDFGNVVVGASKQISVTITNAGDGVLFDGAEQISVDDNSSSDPQITRDSSDCSRTAIAKDETCVYTFTFSPTASGPVSYAYPFKLIYNTRDDDMHNGGQTVTQSLSITLKGVGALTCGGLTSTITGTPGADTLTGTPGDDVIAGGGGDDVIDGGGGNDIICGGDGNDSLSGGAGNDRLFGDAGNDKLKGGGGKDVCKGQAGKDTAKKCEKVASL